MATWKVKADDGQSWVIDAPDDVSEAEVNAFAAENADSWVNGGHYRMTEATEPVAQTRGATPARVTTPASSQRNVEAAAAAQAIAEQMRELQTQIQGLTTRQYAGPSADEDRKSVV